MISALRQDSVTPLKQKNREEWTEYWLNKVDEEVIAGCIESADALDFPGIISSLISEHRGHPASITAIDVSACSQRFDSREPGLGTRALTFFYNTVIRSVSDEYRKNLAQIRAALEKGPDCHVTPDPEVPAQRSESDGRNDTPDVPVKPTGNRLVDGIIDAQRRRPASATEIHPKKPLNGSHNEKKAGSGNLGATKPAASFITEQNRPSARQPETMARTSHLRLSEYRHPSGKTNELVQELLHELRFLDYSKRTIESYVGAASEFMQRPTSVREGDWIGRFKEHIIWLKNERGLASNTVNQYAAAIAFFLDRVLKVVPAKDVAERMKTDKTLPRVHSRETIAQIIMAPRSAKHRLMLMLGYGCGLRLSEIRMLKPADIDLERKVLWVRVGKGRKDRMVMLDEDLLGVAASWLKDGCGTRFLFEGYTPGTVISRRSIENVYNHSCEKIGVDNQGGIHSLRHSFATHLLEQGTNLRIIQELLGHRSAKTTEIYTHVAANQITAVRSPIAGMLNR